MTTLPMLVPVLLVVLVAAGLACRPLGRALEAPTWVAFVLVAAIGLIVGVTLTPLREAPSAFDPSDLVPDASGPLWRWPWQWWPIDDRTLNVLLFVPLGLAVALVGRRSVRWVLIVLALLSPLVVEGTQWAVDWLGRDSQWQDVADNFTGVVIGLLLGWVVRRLTVREPRPT